MYSISGVPYWDHWGEHRQILSSGAADHSDAAYGACITAIHTHKAAEAILTAFYFAGDVAPAQAGNTRTRQQDTPRMQCGAKGKVKQYVFEYCGNQTLH